MPKPNYQHARRQKEMARKARQQDKQQRRTREAAAAGTDPSGSPEQAQAVPEPIGGVLKAGSAPTGR